MTEVMQLLVIDDNIERSHDIKTILEFIGEPCSFYGSDNWQQGIVSPSHVIGIFIGQVNHYQQTIQLLSEIYKIDPVMPVVLLDDVVFTGDVTKPASELVVGRITWPLHQNEILTVIHSCQSCRNGHQTPQQQNRSQQLFRSMVGKSEAMRETRGLIERVADSDASVLILGESGTGKEVAARNLHYLSDRAEKPFVPINCGAIPAELLESELFGHEKGAFTGALTTRKGRFELAEGGTIFLDEIGDMPMPMQVKLLRVLQERTFERVGSGTSLHADVRIIAATHRQLDIEVKENRFREDLFYRLNVFPIVMPSLREREEDVPLLVNELIARLENDKRGTVRLSPSAMQSLMKCRWPGNVRELSNLMERLCILFPYGVVDLKDLPSDYQHSDGLSCYPKPELADRRQSPIIQEVEPLIQSGPIAALPEDGIDLKEFVKKLEISYIDQALEEEDWVVARAAKRLGMRRTTLVEKMRKYSLQKAS
ncbi:MAG: sigma-54 dependent transcriptional regulator [Enterobacterales bacterium]|nr:sigma-54 dependent transcriptional regulator [Enterobacterales bacterium]